jgi:hypothetical protein
MGICPSRYTESGDGWKSQQHICTRLPLYTLLTPKGLGLRLPKLPIGLANPLLWPLSKLGGLKQETTATWSPTSTSSKSVKTEAALSRTKGTEFSSCSVPFERGI